MGVIRHNPDSVFAPYSNYSHAIEVTGEQRLLFISGLNGYERDRQTMPESFEGQATLIWTWIGEILASAGMNYTNLINVRFYLADPAERAMNTAVRHRFLGDHCPTITVIACTLLDPAWKIEIEAVAAG